LQERMTSIKHSYMVWAGTEYYPTFDHLLDEIKRIGFSKRLPGAPLGRTLAQPGTVLYVAHDDGQVEQCKACLKLIPCPECRIRKQAIAALEKELADFKSQFASEEAIQKSGFASRTVAIRLKKINKAKADIAACPLCKGAGKAKLGSGGSVHITGSGTWDYRTFNYWMRQPDKFDASQVVSKSICEECGGRGCLPRGYIHGALLIDRVEYHVKPGEVVERKKGDDAHELDDLVIVKKSVDAKRLSGDKREAGGFYAISNPERNPKAIGMAQHMVAAKIIPAKGYAVHGSFIHFLKPIHLPLGAKRFRGVASYTPKGSK
jgi:hypothetical protein